MQITVCTKEDKEAILALYEDAFAYQKILADEVYQEFDPAFIEPEIKEGRQWKIVVEDEVACVFAISFDEIIIWKDKSKDQAIYLHRIATSPLFRGNSFLKYIVAWSAIYARQKGKKFLRMHAANSNPKLHGYFMSCGFDHLVGANSDNGVNLSAHREEQWTLFQMVV
jgi:hypothetical protein